jgi:Serine aminopeptidase, S33
MRSLFCLFTILLAPSLLYAQGQSGSQPSSAAPESSLPRQASVVTEPIILETPTGKLFGALELPKSSAPLPVALIIAGSGPTDRNGNTRGIPGANNSLKYLAEGLAAQGIASVHYDKRGVAESIKAATSQSELRFETYIDDAVLWGKQLRADKRFTSVIIIGHSEGSLIGMVSVRINPVSGCIWATTAEAPSALSTSCSTTNDTRTLSGTARTARQARSIH